MTNVYGDPTEWSLQGTMLLTLLSFVNVYKYPPSLLYLLLTLGSGFLLLAAFESVRGKLGEVLQTFGRVPLFFYVHIALAHLAAGLIAFAMVTARRCSSIWRGRSPSLRFIRRVVGSLR